MNRDFVKNGPVDPESLFVQENCRDNVLSGIVISSLIYTLSQVMLLDEQLFDMQYPYA